MVHIIGREAVQDLLTTGQARLVEVLPEEEYAWAHLPGAHNLPPDKVNTAAAGRDLSQPVIVYSRDWLCDLSARAARRLERQGMAPAVHWYRAGKMDWLAADLPYEGSAALVAWRVRRDPVLAHLDDVLADVANRIVADPAGLAVVVDHDRVVHGVIGTRELEHADPLTMSAEQAMRSDVVTIRPSEELTAVTQRLAGVPFHHVVVTQPDGTLVGVFGIADLREQESESDLG